MPKVVHNALTDAKARALKAAPVVKLYADGGGLYLRVLPTGAKSWILRTVSGADRLMRGLGAYPMVPLAEARHLAYDMRRTLKGASAPVPPGAPMPTTPAAQPAPVRPDMPTVEEAARIVHKIVSAKSKSEMTRRNWIARLEMHAFPKIGATLICDLRARDVTEVLEPIWAQDTGQKVRGALNQIMNWAIGKEYFDKANPVTVAASGLKSAHGKVKKTEHHAALPWAGVPEFVRQLRAPGGNLVGDTALEFLIVTAKRSGEVRFAAWPEFDLNARVWTIPGARTKTGVDEIVPLTPQALEILARAKMFPDDGNGLVFPGSQKGKPLSNKPMLAAATRAGATVHGFRSSFMDWAAETTDYPVEIREACLGHAVSGVVKAAYLRTTFFDKRAKLMAEWANFCAGPAPGLAVVKAA